MSQSQLQLDDAAARALSDLSSNIHARSQPSTPQNERGKTPMIDHHHTGPPILDLLLSTKKPKSRLRQMAEKSAIKYKRNSLAQSQDQPTDGPASEHTFDLGIPSPPIFDTELASQATKRNIRRRSSVASRRPLTTNKAPKPIVDESFEIMLKDLKIADPVPKPSTLVPPPAIATAERKSRRITIVHISSSSEEIAQLDLEPGHNQGEVFETKECNGGHQVEDGTDDVIERLNLNVEGSGSEQEGGIQLMGKKGKKKLILSDSDSEDDHQSTSNRKVQVKIPDSESEDEDQPISNHKVPVKIQDSENEEDQLDLNHNKRVEAEDTESDDGDEPVLNHKPHNRIPSSDSEIEDAQSADDDESALETKDIINPESPLGVSMSYSRRQQPHLSRGGVVLEIDSSDSDDSIKISPTRQARFNAERAKMLATVPHAGPSQSVLEAQPIQKPKKTMTTKQANLGTLTLLPTQPKIVKPVTQPKTPKPRAPRSAVSKTTTTKTTATKREIPFAKRRDELAEQLIQRLNTEVFDSKLPLELDLVWSNRLNTTAGKAKWSVYKDSTGQVVSQKVVVELGTKVVDSESKLRNTLAHELCHVATWIIDRQKDEKHGKYFKAWAAKIHKLIPEIHVTTKHTYEIDYKFNWTCATPTCLQKYGRHSNSIKPDKQMCTCGGTLVPVPRVRKRAGVTKKMVVEEVDESSQDGEDGLAKMMGNLAVKPGA